MSDKTKIGRAFRSLKSKGYETNAGRSCCGSCTTAEFKTNRFAYYHRQDAARFDEFGDIPVGEKLYIGHGEDGDGYEIMRALNEQGLLVAWDGTDIHRLAVIGQENA